MSVTTPPPVNLVVMEGDGIGPEITGATLVVVRAADRRFGLNLAFTPVAIGMASLLAAGASSGVIRRLGPMLSVRFEDDEGFEGEVNCFDPAYDPSTLRDEDEVLAPDWLDRTRRVMGNET